MFISFKQIAAIPFSPRLGNPLKYDETIGSPTHIQFSAFMMGKTPKSNKIKMNSLGRMVIIPQYHQGQVNVLRVNTDKQTIP